MHLTFRPAKITTPKKIILIGCHQSSDTFKFELHSLEISRWHFFLPRRRRINVAQEINDGPPLLHDKIMPFKTRCQQGLLAVESPLKCTLPPVICMHDINSCLICIGWLYICFACERCDMSSINKRSTWVVVTFNKNSCIGELFRLKSN